MRIYLTTLREISLSPYQVILSFTEQLQMIMHVSISKERKLIHFKKYLLESTGAFHLRVEGSRQVHQTLHLWW